MDHIEGYDDEQFDGATTFNNASGYGVVGAMPGWAELPSKGHDGAMSSFPRFPRGKVRIGLLGVAFDESSFYQRGSKLAPSRIARSILMVSLF